MESTSTENLENLEKLEITKEIKVIKERTYKTISDREILSIIKEEKNFPVSFSSPIKLKVLVKSYNKYWNGDYTDDDDSFSD